MARPARPAPLRAVFFDLDGTLIDSFAGLAGCYRHALEGLGRRPPGDDELRWCVGPPLRRNLARLLGDDALVERGVTLFRERYDSIGWSESVVYDGVSPMVDAVRDSGFRVFVATGKPLVYAERILRHHGLHDRFEGAFGPGLDKSLDDKIHLLAHALDVSKIHPGEAVLVGDRENDVTAAKGNGVPCVGVTWGYGSREELADAGADVVCETPTDVVAAVHAMARARA
jgi:phosphoglycolate phosphatase